MKKLGLAAAMLALAGPAFGHSGHGLADGWLHGLTHPLLGPDHLLAMLTVGLWSGFVLQSRVWAGAAVFMAAMTAGAALAWSGIGFALAEPMSLASVLVFGLLTLISQRGQAAALTLLSLAMVAVFATAHGYAHASEATGTAPAYLAGFLITTAALHLAGFGIARAVASRPVMQGALATGATLSGLWMLAA